MLEFDSPPYTSYIRLLESLRESDLQRPKVAYREQREPGRGTHDANGTERARLAHMMLLFAVASDVELVRFLLDAEITARRNDSFQGAGDTLTILSLLLLEFGDSDASDTWRFWLAKRANFDTFAGGYDIEFVFSQLAPRQVLKLVEERAPAGESEMLERYNLAEIVDGLDDWRVSLAGRHPRSEADLTTNDCEHWAELFGDLAGQERYGLQNAATPEARAHLYRRLGRHADAVAAWRAAADAATSAWDRASRLSSAVSDAAKASLDTLEDVSQLDALRRHIPSWNNVGLGRMSTQACYELAAAVENPDTGRRLWLTAEGWRGELASLSLVGLQAAVSAAEKWGESEDVANLRSAALAEHERIFGAGKPFDA